MFELLFLKNILLALLFNISKDQFRLSFHISKEIHHEFRTIHQHFYFLYFYPLFQVGIQSNTLRNFQEYLLIYYLIASYFIQLIDHTLIEIFI
jgi:hypothetical protein